MLARIIDAVGKLPSTRAGRPERDDHYGALVRSIVGQQLSVLAARAIYGRLTERFGGRPPTPQELLADEPEELRAAAGLSRAKVGFLRSLAEHVLSGELELAAAGRPARRGGDRRARRGQGPGRVDVAHVLDVPPGAARRAGGRRSRASAARSNAPTAWTSLPSAAEMEAIAEPWRPYRTLACRYLWRSLDNEPT